MRRVGIQAISVALPPTHVSVATLLDDVGLTRHERTVVNAFGIETVVATGATAHDLAVSAARDVLAEAGVDPMDIDVLLCIPSRVPERLMCSETTRIQAELGMSRAIALSTGDLGCASSSAALLLADSLLQADHTRQKVLIVHGSTTPTPSRIRLPVTVNGDAGVAVLVGVENVALFVDAVGLRTSGEYWDLFYVDYLDRPREQWRETCADLGRYSFQLAMDSRRVLSDLLAAQLDARDVKLADVSYVVTQNLSAGAFEFYEQALNRAVADVCRTNLRHLGHLGAADLFVNLGGLLPGLAAGERIVAINNSPAAAWSVCLLESPA